MKLKLSVLAVLALWSVPVSIASVPQAAPSRPLRLLSDWLLRTGKPSVMRGHILEAMNLPPHDMPVRERGFRHQGERITHVSSVSSVSGYQDLIFFAQVDEGDGSATVWRTRPDGVLVSTVRFADGKVERVPNEQFNSGFAEEKLIFLIRMRMHEESR
jgi:hypothetical protein